MTALSPALLAAFRDTLAGQPDASRAFLLPGADKSTLVLEYDERPPSVGAAQMRLQRLLAILAPALGDAAQMRLQRLLAVLAPALGDASFGIAFSAGGPEDVARLAAGAEPIYERGRVE